MTKYNNIKQITLIEGNANNEVELHTYDLENRIEKTEIINDHFPEQLNSRVCTVQLPNNNLFCYGNRDKNYSGITFIIERNDNNQPKIQLLPAGHPCYASGGVYFNNSVYIFGGFNGSSRLSLAQKYDLNANK